MRVFLLLVSFFFSSSFANAENNNCSDSAKEYAKKYVIAEESELESMKVCEKVTEKYLDRDFSELLFPASEFLGFIGSDYQRLYITFMSIKKDKSNNKIYHVEGRSKVNENEVDFIGEIVVEEIDSILPHYEIDGRFRNAGIKAQGILLAKYEFRENAGKKYSGIFSGNMSLQWLVDKDNQLQYDVCDWAGSSNNSYEGKWKSYKTKIGKIANWGDERIPNSGDLDVGSDDGFSPDKKYKGWSDFEYRGDVVVVRKNKLRNHSFASDPY